MKIEQCKICNFNTRTECGAVYCGYTQNIVSMPIVLDLKTNDRVILNCPKEEVIETIKRRRLRK